MEFIKKEHEIFFNENMKEEKLNDVLQNFIVFLHVELLNISVGNSHLSFPNNTGRYFFNKNLDVIVVSVSNNKYFEYSEHFFNYCSNFYKTKYDVESFSINFLNFLLSFLVSLNEDNYNQKIKYIELFNNIYEHSDHAFKAKFLTYIKSLNYFNIDFDWTNFCIIRNEQKWLLDDINNINISNIVYNFKKAESIDEKYIYFSYFAKIMYSFFSNKKRFNKWHEVLEKYFTPTHINNLSGQCNGYFRHNKNDKKNKLNKYTEEWNTFDDEIKNKIMKTTLSQYLFILSILKDSNIEIEELLDIGDN